jgi:hypothetical protein
VRKFIWSAICSVLLLASVASAQLINCPDGFTSSGQPCGVGFFSSGGNVMFQVVGTQSGSNPSLSGSRVNLMPAGANHAAMTLAYFRQQVNVQAFDTTFTFVPNGQNFSFMLNNVNNQTYFNGATFSAGAGCEADFFQGYGETHPPNNVFAVDFDSYQPEWTFTNSNVQIYKSNPYVQCPCLPGGSNCGTNNSGAELPKISTSPVAMNSPANASHTTTGHTYSANLVYDGSNLTLNLYDVTAGDSCPGAKCFTNVWPGVDIPASVNGNVAWLGLGSSTGSGNLPTTSLYVSSLVYTEGMVKPPKPTATATQTATATRTATPTATATSGPTPIAVPCTLLNKVLTCPMP